MITTEPKAPQPCENCGTMVETYAQWFSEDCPKQSTDLIVIGHHVPDYLKLPVEEVNDGNNN